MERVRQPRHGRACRRPAYPRHLQPPPPVRKSVHGHHVTYAYDTLGELAQAASADCTVTFQRDAAGRIVAESVDERTLTFQCDALGRRTQRTTPTGAVSQYRYDAAGNRSSVSAFGKTTTSAHDAAAREIARHIGPHVALGTAYDEFGRIATQSLHGSGGELWQRTYGYRSDGHVTAIDDARDGRLRLDLDTVGRVTSVTAATWSETYAYDEAGNQNAAQWLTLRRDGGVFHPMPGDGWTADTYEAVLTVERELLPTCTAEAKEVIWRTLQSVLTQLGRIDVQDLVVEGDARPLPNIPPDWRIQGAVPGTPIVRGLRIAFSSTEFDVTCRDFTDLEIRGAQDSSGFHYLYDTRARRMITDFVLDDRPQVATMCSVTIIKKGDTFTPRIKLWKKDKKKAGAVSATQTVPESGATRAVKALVDTGDAHENFWKVINFLQGCTGLSTPGDSLQLVAGDGAQLAQLLIGQDRTTMLGAVRTAIGGGLTEEDIRLISNRKEQFQRFERLLTDSDYFQLEESRATTRGAEAVWQAFFEANQWIFGYGLNLIACESIGDGKLERITTGANIFGGAGKRIDAIMRSKGLISSMLFCEIKTHETELLARTPYRAGVYQASKELGGGVAQVQKTVSRAQQLISREFLTRIHDDDGTPTGIELSTTRPRQVVVIGSLREFTDNGAVNPEKINSFELYRTSIQDVEIITFDELYQRACFIVEDR